MIRIACIDEDANLREMLDLILTEAGFETVQWPGLMDIRAFLRRERPDMLLVEMRLDGDDTGVHLLEGLRIDPETADIPVIVCSGDSRFLRMHGRALRTLAAAVIEKPFTVEQLLTTVRRIADPARFGGRRHPSRWRKCATC